MPTLRAAGTFEVTLTPHPGDGTPFARVTVAKRFHGALDASSEVEMLSAVTAVKGSAAYVALELVRGSLCGHTGTFMLQHTGVMDRGRPSLAIAVVPDSGTGALTGLTGTMTIEVSGGAHRYEITAAVPADV
jgi:hypothetical protein